MTIAIDDITPVPLHDARCFFFSGEISSLGIPGIRLYMVISCDTFLYHAIPFFFGQTPIFSNNGGPNTHPAQMGSLQMISKMASGSMEKRSS